MGALGLLNGAAGVGLQGEKISTERINSTTKIADTSRIWWIAISINSSWVAADVLKADVEPPTQLCTFINIIS